MCLTVRSTTDRSPIVRRGNCRDRWASKECTSASSRAALGGPGLQERRTPSLLAGLTYGFTVKSLTDTEDVVTAVTDSVKNMSGYIVMMFVAAQVIALFNWSNLGVLLAVKAAALFDSVGVTGFWAILAFVLLASCLNLFVVSGSALWSLVGPVFIPAFMLMGMSPALSQAAFRIGDSATGAITPMNPYLFLFLAMLRQYEPEARLGTLISRLAIFVVPFLVVWLAILGIFYGFDLPLGPGAHIGLK